jgi:beta-lactamase regulating signal transducer with metallopeptidase domain
VGNLDLSPFWTVALLALPLSILVGLIGRCLPHQPVARHAMWVTVLFVLVVLPFIPAAPRSDIAAFVRHATSTADADDDASTGFQVYDAFSESGARRPFQLGQAPGLSPEHLNFVSFEGDWKEFLAAREREKALFAARSSPAHDRQSEPRNKNSPMRHPDYQATQSTRGRQDNLHGDDATDHASTHHVARPDAPSVVIGTPPGEPQTDTQRPQNTKGVRDVAAPATTGKAFQLPLFELLIPGNGARPHSLAADQPAHHATFVHAVADQAPRGHITVHADSLQDQPSEHAPAGALRSSAREPVHHSGAGTLRPASNSDGSTTNDTPSAASAASSPAPPPDIVTPVPHATPTMRSANRWTQWQSKLATIRDAVFSLPPIPGALWIGGAVCIAVFTIIRLERFRLLVGQCTPAPPDVLCDVQRAARMIGVARIPRVVMSEAGISPLIWCGPRKQLILPRGLWEQLDDTGRQAVLCHELAHLKRRDHWICWVMLLVSWMYWWHPVVWWIRRRVREEADLCCDIWVTTLLPGSRRAYATALLQTRQYTTLSIATDNAMSLHVHRPQAKRFARRLTMVMSRQMTPHLTTTSVLLVACIAGASWLVTPSLACPDPEPESEPQAVELIDATELREVHIADAPESCTDPTPAILIESPGMSLRADRIDMGEHGNIRLISGDFEIEELRDALADLETLERADLSIEERLAMIEHKMDMLMSMLDHKLAQVSESMPEIEAMIESAAVPALEALQQNEALREYMSALGMMEHDGAARVYAPDVPQAQTPVIEKSYHLPDGRLEALTALLALDDVPVLIRPGSDDITLYGTVQQHMVFQAFVDMISGDDTYTEIYELPTGRLEALTDLMRRSDVPVMIEPHDDHIVLHGNKLQHTIFGAFVEMLADDQTMPLVQQQLKALNEGRPLPTTATAPRGATRSGGGGASGRTVRVDDVYAGGGTGGSGRSAEAHSRVNYNAQINALRTQLASYQSQYHALDRQQLEYEYRVRQLEAELDHYENSAEELEDQSHDADATRRVELVRRANELRMQAYEIQSQIRLLEVQMDILDAQRDQLDSQTDAVEDAIDELESERDNLTDSDSR